TERLLHFLGIAQVVVTGKEADDVVAVMVRSYKGRCILVTADKDYFQLVSERVGVWNPHKQVHADLENFKEVTGVEPAHFLLGKAILGDVSDNIGGVNGIGDKTMVEMMGFIQDSKDSPLDLLAELALQVAREGSTRQKKLLDQVETVYRNLSLMDLSQEEFSYDEICHVLSSISVSLPFQERLTLEEFKVLQFAEFMRDFVSFSAPFRTLQ
ncbi:hypothetical protein LCGC14_2969040, partial [marine sediment metagenome]